MKLQLFMLQLHLQLQVKEFQVPYQPTVEPLHQYPIVLVL